VTINNLPLFTALVTDDLTEDWDLTAFGFPAQSSNILNPTERAIIFAACIHQNLPSVILETLHKVCFRTLLKLHIDTTSKLSVIEAACVSMDGETTYLLLVLKTPCATFGRGSALYLHYPDNVSPNSIWLSDIFGLLKQAMRVIANQQKTTSSKLNG
jgi:hypothetical protein